MSAYLSIFEAPGHCWPNAYYADLKIDRSETRVFEFLRDELQIEWTSNLDKASIVLRKAELSRSTANCVQAEINAKTKYQSWPQIHLIGEPRELAPVAYEWAEPSLSLAVAPGQRFGRLYFCAEWRDPELENWSRKKDRICWIGRPLPDRVALAKRLLSVGLPLDIYSRQPWPLNAWRGPAADDVETARQYKYRIVCENSKSQAYHSEKLFTAIRSGNVPYYIADPSLEIPEIANCFLSICDEHLFERDHHAKRCLEAISQFMFSSRWEIYSPKAFYHRIARLAQTAIQNFEVNFSQVKSHSQKVFTEGDTK